MKLLTTEGHYLIQYLFGHHLRTKNIIKLLNMVFQTWHKFVSPLDSIPIGYKYSCISYARNTHFLTPDFDLYDKDMAGIFQSLVEFLGGDEEDLPPLYVVADHMPAADCITDFITSRAQSPIKIKVFSLNKLLQELANLPSIYIAEAFLDDTTKFNHFKGRIEKRI